MSQRLFSRKLIYLFFTVVVTSLYLLTLRGNIGVPTVDDIYKQHFKNGTAFETSQEGSRYAMLLSIVHEKKVNLDGIAKIGTPDVGFVNGHYYSLFPPTLSILAIPFYHVGLFLGATQMMVYVLPTLFALASIGLIIKVCQKLSLPFTVGLFSAFAFAFATNTWGYSVTFYAHTASAFLMLSMMYITLFWTKKFTLLKIFLFSFIYGLAVYIDYPNLVTASPIAILFLWQSFKRVKSASHFVFTYDWRYVLFPLIFVCMLLAYGYYNYILFGNPFQMSNSLARIVDFKNGVAEHDQTFRAVLSLSSRNLLEGLRSFLFSLDRSLPIYSPIVLLSLLSIGYFKDAMRKRAEILFFSVALLNLVQYSMFGDPYGGWAFGSRYMIAVMPELCILAGIGLFRFSKHIGIKVLYSLIFLYSAAVGLLAPLTTNVIPQLSEAKSLGLDYTYIVNIHMLEKNQLNSFVYNHILSGAWPGFTYYFTVLGIVSITGLLLIWGRREQLHDAFIDNK